MNAIVALRALGPVDYRNVVRDPMLRWLALIPLLLALLVREVMPAFIAVLSRMLGFDLMPYYVPLMSYAMLMLTPNIAGIVTGFLLLDQRDDETLSALRVTPLTLAGYLLYRLALPTALSVVMTVVTFPVAGLEVLPVPLVLAAATAAPGAALFALFLAAFARNKVQGFALMKATGVVLWPPMAALFVGMPLQLLFGLVPSYWAGKLYWTALAGGAHYAVYLFAGLAYQGLLLYLLLRRYLRVMHRG